MTDKELISKICKFSYIMSIIGICTLGICPAFAAMAIAVCIVIKNKKTPLSADDSKKLKIAKIISTVSLILFCIDIVIALCVFK